MSWLKALGKGLLTGAKVAANVTPYGQFITPFLPKAAQPAVQTVTGTLEGIAGVIVHAEALGQAMNAPGTAKLSATVPLVALMIQQSPLLGGRAIDDPEKFQAGVTKITDGLVDILNSLTAETAPVPNPPPAG